jgi:hypothetical protein
MKKEDPWRKAMVDVAFVALDLAGDEISGPIERDSLKFARKLRVARRLGAPKGDLDKEIDRAEGYVIDSCDTCYTIIEDAR